MKYYLGKRILVGAFIIITVLLAVNFIFTFRNSSEIDHNMLLQQRSERIKMDVSRIAIDIVHNLDLGIRSYALFKDPKYLYPYYKALERKDSIFNHVETLLLEENYNLQELNVLKDSVESYTALNAKLKLLIDQNNDKQFLYLANQDRGYKLWLQYERFANRINDYENQKIQHAKNNYDAALVNNYFLQVVLFFLCIPTLLFTTINTFKAFVLEKRFRNSEKERADFLKHQNENLEKTVAERTSELMDKNRKLQQHDEEIAAQNEEIRAQNDILVKQQDQIADQRDLLTVQNHKLLQAQDIIVSQADEIRKKNESLEIEIQRKTRELVINNQQLEQFAFLSAHNLRAPVARILGLGNILKVGAKNPGDEKLIIQKIIKSTFDLDMVIKDLTTILEIKTNINAQLSQINFSEEFHFVKSNLLKELWENNCQINENFEDAPSVVTVKPYIDSILFNLISNSIKYRCLERDPVINLSTRAVKNFICLTIEDNGIGIDLKKYGKEIFSLYKRFHTHTEGKGLGLHLVKMQAIALGGSVNVASQPGKGTVFTVYIKTHPTVGSTPFNEPGLEIVKPLSK